MFKSFRGRELDFTKPVQVYRNLRTKGLSLKQDGVVVAHTKEEVTVEKVKFIVNESGRKRVLREQQKNVHAFVEGILLQEVVLIKTVLENKPVLYNPYKMDSFSTEDGQKLEGCKILRIAPEGNMWGTGLKYKE